MNLLHRLSGGKNSKLTYYARHALTYVVPPSVYSTRLKRVLKEVPERDDYEYIKHRVDYYNKLDKITQLPADASPLSEHKFHQHKTVYFFDAYEFIRWFPATLKWCYIFGDVTRIPDMPSIVKSRPIHGSNENSILLNLNKVRHFIFLNDSISFAQKDNMAIFRGRMIKKRKHRARFMELYFDHPLCDLGEVGSRSKNYHKWGKEKISLMDHLQYKFIFTLEGNDVASNLKWVMSSNSIAVMPKPKYETWFMEGKLIPNHHYIEINPDFSDVEERINYYIHHTDEAEQIVSNAHKYVAQFKNQKREELISLLVLKKYFIQTGQSL